MHKCRLWWTFHRHIYIDLAMTIVSCIRTLYNAIGMGFGNPKNSYATKIIMGMKISRENVYIVHIL